MPMSGCSINSVRLPFQSGCGSVLWRRTLIGNPLCLWRVVKQQLVLSTRYTRDAAQSLSKGLGLLRFDEPQSTSRQVRQQLLLEEHGV